MSLEERYKIDEKVTQALEQVGGERIIVCNSAWGSDKWQLWGVEKFPDIEAIQKHDMLLWKLNWYHYIESTFYLGTELPAS